MLESKQISAYDDASNAFVGIRFALFGFDPVREEKVRSKLLEGGGVDVVNYGPDCSHVIVDKLVYDDPICVAARRDGKILATGLWVDHSFDLGMPVDPTTSVMYGPVRDLNGIPGAKSLLMCLTGYQRQDRDDIMNMVALMGANFSKPLLAHKVTHLICYKFEGEKYELGKKMSTIKLVNHQWLEDCLKAWELLPEEGDYAKSGYELEMEAEAKDSEDETEDMVSLDPKKKSIVSPQNTRLEKKYNYQSPLGASRNTAYVTAVESFANVGNTSKTQSTPRKETDFGKASLSRDMSNSSCARSPAKISNVPDGTAISEKIEHILASPSGSAKKSVDGGLSKLSMKSSLPLRSERIENNSGSPSSNVSKTGLHGGFNTPTKRDLDGTDYHGIRSPLKGRSLLPDEGQTVSSPSKKKPTIPRGSSRSPAISHSPNPLIKSGSATKPMEMLVSRSSTDGTCRLALDTSPTNGTGCMREEVSGGFVVPSEKIQDGTGSGGGKSPLKGGLPYLDEEQTSGLPSKKKMALSRSGSKSTKLSRSPKILTGSGSNTKPMEMPVLREKVSDVINMPSERDEDVVEAGGIKTPLDGAPLQLNEEQTRSLPSRKKSTVSCSNSKSTKLSRSRKTLVESGLDTKATEMLLSPPTNITSCLREEVSSAPKEAVAVSTLQEDRQECNGQTPHRSRGRPKKQKLPDSDVNDLSPGRTKSCTGGEETHQSVPPDIDQTPHRSRGRPKKQKLLDSDVNDLSPGRTKSCTGGEETHQSVPPDIGIPSLSISSRVEKSDGQADLDSSKVDHSGTKSKSPKKKMLARKTLGSKPTICKGKTTRNKGFLSALLQKEFTGRSNGAVAIEATNNVPLAEKGVTVSLRTNEDVPMGDDHETEAPECEGMDDFDIGSKDSAEVEEPHSEKPAPKRKQPSEKTTKMKKGAKSGVKKSTETPECEVPNDFDMGSKDSAEAEEPHSEKPTPSRKQPSEKTTKMKKGAKSGVKKSTEAPECEVPNDFDMGSKESAEAKEPHSEKPTPSRKQPSEKTTKTKKGAKAGVKKSTEAKESVCSQKTVLAESTSTGNVAEKKITAGKKRPLAKSKINESKDPMEETKQDEKKNEEKVVLAGKTKTTKRPAKKLKSSGDVEKENEPITNEQQSVSCDKGAAGKSTSHKLKTPLKNRSKPDKVSTEDLNTKTEPACFILSGHRLQRKEFQQVIKRLRGRVCRDSHNWSYQATHSIVPDPIRRTEKFFAAAASGSWILKTDYLTASTEAGRFVSEEPYEWHKKCLTEDGAINLEAPRKWRLLRERTGHGAFYGMRIVIYGECIAPPLDTLKRVVKAGDGTILATSPPYTRFLNSRIDFAIVSPGMPRVDMWVQEFLRHEVPCVLADYLVEYVCKPGYSLERHVQYNTHAWAKRSLENVINRVDEPVEEDPKTPEDECVDDAACQVCGERDRGDEMLICGDESGTHGCGVGTHMDCLDPPLEAVPKEDWFCRNCCRKGEANTGGRSSKKRALKSK